MKSKSAEFVSIVTNSIFKESINRNINPRLIFDAIHRVFDNKIKLVESVANSYAADLIDVIPQVLEIESENNEARRTDVIDAVRYAISAPSVEHFMCKCKVEPVYTKGQWKADITIPRPKKIHFSGNRTIVIWEDNTKTIVKCAEGQVFDEYSGFVAALAKKAFGSTTQVKKIIDEIGKGYEPRVKETTQDDADEAVADSDVNIKNY